MTTTGIVLLAVLITGLLTWLVWMFYSLVAEEAEDRHWWEDFYERRHDADVEHLEARIRALEQQIRSSRFVD